MRLATTDVVATPPGDCGKISGQIMAKLVSKAWTNGLSNNIGVKKPILVNAKEEIILSYLIVISVNDLTDFFLQNMRQKPFTQSEQEDTINTGKFT